MTPITQNLPLAKPAAAAAAGPPGGGVPGGGAPMGADPLANLRDIHLPGPVSDFPIAPGWWILAIALLLVAFFSIRWLWRYWRSNRYRRDGIKQLNRILQQFQTEEDPQLYLSRYSELLKRIALTRYPREKVASLTGEEWVAFLDRSFQSKDFSIGPGQILVYGCYEPNPEFDVNELHALGAKWIKGHKARLPS